MNYSEPFNLAGYTDGPHVIYYFSVDRTGNVETVKNASVVLDNTSPLTMHSLNEGLYSNTITITLTVIDEGCGVREICYRIGDLGEWIRYTGPFNITTEGKSTIQYYSVDNLGNKETRTVTYTIDMTPPETTILVGSPRYTREEKVFITYETETVLEAIDVVSGNNNTLYKIDDGLWVEYAGPFNLSDNIDGQHLLYYFTIDKAGNVETIKNMSITLDTAEPSISIDLDPSSPDTTQKVSFIVTVNDNPEGAGIANVSLYIDGHLAEMWTTAGTHTYNGGPYMSGTHTYHVEAIDNLGNIAKEPTTGSRALTVSSLPTFPWELVALAIVVVTATAILTLVIRRRNP